MKSNTNVLLPDASVEELEAGYKFDGSGYTCLACGCKFEAGRIYPHKEAYYDAEKMTAVHIEEEHGSVFGFLSGLDKEYTDLTSQQQYALELFYKGANDAEIAKELRIEPSTVRNYRFILRRKERQAKVFLAMMRLYEKHRNSRNEVTVSSKAEASRQADSAAPSAAPAHDTASPCPNEPILLPGGYEMEASEYERLKNSLFTADGRLRQLPSKRKRLTMVLNELIRHFEAGRRYTEMEVNEVIAGVYADYATLRRELIDYKLLVRKSDCSEYWVNQVK